jgi:hypothetical protein
MRSKRAVGALIREAAVSAQGMVNWAITEDVHPERKRRVAKMIVGREVG